MQKSSFFNSVNGDRKYNASDYAAYFGSFIGNGVYPNPGNNLAVTVAGGMNISVAAGKAWINGYYYENTGTLNISIDEADGVLKRIDRIVLRLDHLNRQIVLSVLKGTPASSPVAPILTRSADNYELGIADILINNGDTGVNQTQITDLRYNAALCGIVSGVVEQIDTTGLFYQYDAAFNGWFSQVQNILSGDVAGNILNQINIHKSDYTNHVPHLGITSNVDNAYSITSSKNISDGSKFSVKFNAAATGTSTLTISSDGTPGRLTRPGGSDFKPKAGTYSFIRDGENFQCLGEGGDYGNIVESNVDKGVIFGTEDGLKVGTSTKKKWATGTGTTAGTQNAATVVSGIGFIPKTIVVMVAKDGVVEYFVNTNYQSNSMLYPISGGRTQATNGIYTRGDFGGQVMGAQNSYYISGVAFGTFEFKSFLLSATFTYWAFE